MRQRDELMELLAEHLDWLDASAERYDQGHKSEAKRLATIARTLLHDTGTSLSLLGQLGMRGSLPFADSANGDHSASSFAITIVRMRIGPSGMEYSPKLGPIAAFIPFDEWWKNTVLKSPEGGSWSRYLFVRNLVNKDGGAHVDPKLPPEYRRLTRENGFGWKYEGDIFDSELPHSDPVAPAMRQIAHELAATLDQVSEIRKLRTFTGSDRAYGQP